MSEIKIKKQRVARRIKRTRSKMLDTRENMRLSIFASNTGVYAQIIDDAQGTTLISVSPKELGESKGTKSEVAAQLGTLLAKKAADAKVTGNIVFDKGRYKYHGRVKAFADAARAGGLKF